eukprot:GGOE01053491.1.p2 GENE.GGOE01053491.1~~GGOE01053491.1.p2  ORF type:complete len:214 (-),score=33.48 GGOE01053491.1:434-1075(-)
MGGATSSYYTFSTPTAISSYASQLQCGELDCSRLPYGATCWDHWGTLPTTAYHLPTSVYSYSCVQPPLSTLYGTPATGSLCAGTSWGASSALKRSVSVPLSATAPGGSGLAALSGSGSPVPLKAPAVPALRSVTNLPAAVQSLAKWEGDAALRSGTPPAKRTVGPAAPPSPQANCVKRMGATARLQCTETATASSTAPCGTCHCCVKRLAGTA